MTGAAKRRTSFDRVARARYAPPSDIHTIGLKALLSRSGRAGIDDKRLHRLQFGDDAGDDALLQFSGDLDLLQDPAVSIVGTREVSPEGRRRAEKLARELSRAGVVVVSGLARGVDTVSHLGAIEACGRTVAVIGTPIDKAYPAENGPLQEAIYRDHLLISPFPIGGRVFKSNFPKRNRVMAAVSDATVIVEASDTSGTLHQAAECQRLGRWLFIMKSVADDRSLSWPAKFIGHPKTKVLSSTEDILSVLDR